MIPREYDIEVVAMHYDVVGYQEEQVSKCFHRTPQRGSGVEWCGDRGRTRSFICHKS